MRLVCAFLLLQACGNNLETEPGNQPDGCVDEDGDGYGQGAHCLGFDCDDADALRHPGALEVCDDDNRDEDCDTLANDDDPSGATDAVAYYRDADGDGYGDVADQGRTFCSAPSNRALSRDDCDDADAARHPGAAEVCDDNDADEDCNDLSDDEDPAVTGFPDPYYVDEDLDGHGDASDAGTGYCDPGFGRSLLNDDCNDTVAGIHTGTDEVCDALDIDEDCDGEADDADDDAVGTTVWFADLDDDGFGDMNDSGTLYCDAPDHTSVEHTDCDDGNEDVNPGEVEVCDLYEVDEDCQNGADEVNPNATGKQTWYEDKDFDTYGSDNSIFACAGVGNFNVWVSGDCDDIDSPDIHPGATEVCDDANVDEDCDTFADDADPSTNVATKTTWYLDTDDDTYGQTAESQVRCDAIGDYTATAGGDCDDDNAPLINPNGTEICDAGNDDDEDCNTLIDDADPGVTGLMDWWADPDGDGFGDDGTAPVAQRCAPAPLQATNHGDCDEGSEFINPDATEVCDAADTDEDCNGPSDDDDPNVDAAGFSTFYADADGDTFGDAASPILECDVHAGEVADASDCNDSKNGVYPGASEQCDGVKNDCEIDDADWTIDLEDGIVSHTIGAAAPQDVTADFLTEPYVLPAGKVTVCPGTYVVSLYMAEEFGSELTSRDGTRAAAAVTVLDGDGSGTVVNVPQGGVHRIWGLTITGGTGFGGGLKFGGGIYVENGASLQLYDSFVVGNTANRGGGIAAIGFSFLAIFDSDIGGTAPGLGNTADDGGGILIATSSLIAMRSKISGNQALVGGGLNIQTAAQVALDDTEVSSNTATTAGGGIQIWSGDVSCASAGGGGKVLNNTGGVGGGVRLSGGTFGNLAPIPCDFGSGAPGSLGENDPNDVWVEDANQSYDVEGSIAFTCDTTGCVP